MSDNRPKQEQETTIKIHETTGSQEKAIAWFGYLLTNMSDEEIMKEFRQPTRDQTIPNN